MSKAPTDPSYVVFSLTCQPFCAMDGAKRVIMLLFLAILRGQLPSLGRNPFWFDTPVCCGTLGVREAAPSTPIREDFKEKSSTLRGKL
jgi:hypothetical protein